MDITSNALEATREPGSTKAAINPNWTDCTSMAPICLVLMESTGFLSGHRYSLKRTKMKVKTIAWDNVYPRIKRQSNQGFNIPPRQHTGIWLSFFPGGEELEPCMGGVGYLNRTYQVPPAEYTCFIF